MLHTRPVSFPPQDQIAHDEVSRRWLCISIHHATSPCFFSTSLLASVQYDLHTRIRIVWIRGHRSKFDCCRVGPVVLCFRSNGAGHPIRLGIVVPGHEAHCLVNDLCSGGLFRPSRDPDGHVTSSSRGMDKLTNSHRLGLDPSSRSVRHRNLNRLFPVSSPGRHQKSGVSYRTVSYACLPVRQIDQITKLSLQLYQRLIVATNRCSNALRLLTSASWLVHIMLQALVCVGPSNDRRRVLLSAPIRI
ncbi:uncharacterized protein LY79DRAFT_33699 [Colletotrichum navitas]|uniref:Uncharacterized protein n=1 Tax=Colletotrichum navitas TaxID=681940 RepID=A0AAD8Q722_9PEZI|nr:uncharacterized protein LY79DRAFT_33699 [Colletotrichum navitas]KAK1596859.1 hypothetical protein LY79DRAFT_33699 [Colletotrichum navitas]